MTNITRCVKYSKLALVKSETFKKTTVVIVASLVTLAAVEILLRVLYPTSNNYYVWYPNTVATFYIDSGVINGLSPGSKFSINSKGIRGDEQNAESTRVLCIGGSTTECLYLDNTQAWPYLLQNKMRGDNTNTYWVGSIGKSGAKSFDNYVHLKYVQPGTNTNSLLVMTGINDLLRFLSAGNLPQVATLSNEQLDARADSTLQTINLKSDNAFKRMAIYRLVRNAYRSRVPYTATDYLAQDKEGKIYARWRSNRATGFIIDTVPDLTIPLKIYKSNLQEIMKMADSRNCSIGFIQQVALWSDSMSTEELGLLWSGGVGNFQKEGGHSYYSPRVLALCLAQFNAATEEVCRQYGKPFYKLDIPKSSEFFYDDCHFTIKGAEMVAEQVYRQWTVKSVP